MPPVTSVLGVIVARRGSKRLTDKNIKPFLGRPLVAWSIEQALAAKSLGEVVLSSDDQRVLALANDADGVEAQQRPDELAQDTTPIEDVLRHVVGQTEDNFSHIVLLQPTSPLRLSSDIEGALAAASASDAKSCISVCALSKPSAWLMRDLGEGRLHPASHGDETEEQGQIFFPNGAVFVIESQWLMEGNDFYSEPPAYYVMPAERSIDIDSAEDFALAEAVGAARLSN